MAKAVEFVGAIFILKSLKIVHCGGLEELQRTTGNRRGEGIRPAAVHDVIVDGGAERRACSC